MPDIVIPIVFPDYLIAVNIPKQKIKIPDLLPGIDILPDHFETAESKNKVPELGHAGILFINGARGTTKYYEYGRYGGSLGATRRRPIKDVIIGAGGHPTKASLSYTLSQISAKAGQNGRILGAYIEVSGQYQAMLDYAGNRVKENANPNRAPYGLFTNSCVHFMKGVLDAAGVDTPFMIDPRPNSYIEELRSDFPALDYSKAAHRLEVEDGPASFASHVTSQPAVA
ncbi:hypothetical protein [Hahella ganghwensis]|uniref:hypothetical protein n=1 Tax=Hahella ganghwensis TaxID=286420 RepID=UPI00037211D8|nr:hypothetical protein [Hahella ganghwensis]